MLHTVLNIQTATTVLAIVQYTHTLPILIRIELVANHTIRKDAKSRIRRTPIGQTGLKVILGIVGKGGGKISWIEAGAASGITGHTGRGGAHFRVTHFVFDIQ